MSVVTAGLVRFPVTDATDTTALVPEPPPAAREEVVHRIRYVQLRPGERFSGPALVEERETTAVIRPGWEATVLPDGAIVATRGAA